MEQSRPIHDIICDNIPLSRFAKCMGISRPSLYKYMDAYDSKDLDLIPDNILNIFDTVSTRVPRDRLQAYFNDIYAKHIRMEERRLHESPVPPHIAEIVDCEGLNVGHIDSMIDRAQRHLERLLGKDSQDEDEVERVRKDIRDLEYTREMVEKRQSENRFMLIYSSNWTVCIGPEESDVAEYHEGSESEISDVDTMFRFYLTRARSGYTLFFYNEGEGDSVEVQLLTGPRKDMTRDVVGMFRPEPGMRFVRIPDLFDEDFEELFRYRVIRSNGGVVLNTAIGRFTDLGEVSDSNIQI